jgi:hypothetical protein
LEGTIINVEVIEMVYINDERGKMVGIYGKPVFSTLEADDRYAGRDKETGENLYKTIYILKMYFTCGIIRAESNKLSTLSDIERAVSLISDGSPEEKYPVEIVYTTSSGEDLAHYLPL